MLHFNREAHTAVGMRVKILTAKMNFSYSCCSSAAMLFCSSVSVRVHAYVH